MEIFWTIVVLIVIVGLVYINSKPLRFRNEHGSLIEVGRHGSLRLCLEDEQTRKNLINQRKKFHDTFTIKNGKLVRKDNGKVVPLD